MNNEVLKLREAFNKLKGETIYIIDENYNYKMVLEDGGYDHLGPLPPKERQVFTGKTFSVRPVVINEYNLHIVLNDKEPFFFDKETAEWVANARQLGEIRRKKGAAELYDYI